MTSPLGWFFEPKTTIAEFTLTPSSFTIDIKETSSVLAGKVIKNISYTDITYPFGASWVTEYPSFGCDGGKKTLQVTKKDDIKFV